MSVETAALELLVGKVKTPTVQAIIMNTIREFDTIHDKNQEKIKEAKELYFKALLLPRKQKKKLKKKALADYNFWISIDKWYKEVFN